MIVSINIFFYFNIKTTLKCQGHRGKYLNANKQYRIDHVFCLLYTHLTINVSKLSEITVHSPTVSHVLGEIFSQLGKSNS